MFLPVFDVTTDTYEALHKRSPFCVDAICMVAAKVRDGGGPPSETYKKCLKEVHDITCATLFAPVVRQEAVQAMILVAGWGAGPRDSGWLTCGHATRMALELGLWLSGCLAYPGGSADGPCESFSRNAQGVAEVVEEDACWQGWNLP